MTEHVPSLLQAVIALRRAAEAEFYDNRYYPIANEIAALTELVPFSSAPSTGGIAATLDFASALSAVRGSIQQELTGNKYYAAANRLAVLASFVPASPEPHPVYTTSAVFTTHGQHEDGGHSAPSFSDLAASSSAHVRKVASSLSVYPARDQAEVPHHSETPETLADGELERRSSEPCFMAELSPVEVETVAAAAIPAEIPAVSPGPRAPADLGPSAIESGHSPVEEAVTVAPSEAGVNTAPQTVPSVDDCKAPAAGETVSLDEHKSPKKSLFALWLDLMFGPIK